MQVKKRDGNLEAFDKRKIGRSVERAGKDLVDVDITLITDEAYAQLFDGITTAEIDRATVLAARARIAIEPNYTYIAARLLLNSLYREVFGHRVDHRSLGTDYRKAFKTNLTALVEDGRLNPKLTNGTFDLDVLADALDPERDLLFKYLGVQTLYDRYLHHIKDRRLEAPQTFWMRVAMGVTLNEKNPTQAAIEAYELFSTLRYCPGTPTLFNSGSVHSQLSSCYLSTMEDSIDGIYGTLHQQARLSKFAGGLGIDMTPLRGTGAYIKGTNGKGQGLIPWAKQFNDMAVAVNQGGKRKGAAALYLENWHLDYPEFLDLKKNTGDDRRRCHDINTASWIPDLFMKKVKENGDWYLFSPDECPDLHDLCGDEFEKAYNKYVKKAKTASLLNFEVVKAKDLWKKMLSAVRETGHPWMTFKDPSNLRYTDKKIGVVKSSNLCVEILRHSVPTTYVDMKPVKVGETAVCNLGSVNLLAHTDEQGEVQWDILENTVRKAIRILDNVIDLNYYPTEEAKNSNMLHRPVGLGQMGWSDVLDRKKLAFDSDKAISLAGRVQEFISFHAIMGSAELAKERGAYPTYASSLWADGKLPKDTYVDFMKYRGHDVEVKSLMPWKKAYEAVAAYGVRNSNTMAIAPTATISYIVGCSQSIEPNFSVLWVYSTLSGEFTMVNECFVAEMKKLGVWNEEFVKNLTMVDGDVSKIVLPKSVRERFKTAFGVDQMKLIDAAAERQIWIDQGQSLNLYFDGDSMKALSDIYFHAWERGLKTTYYLRTRGASKVEKGNMKIEKTSGPSECRVGDLMESCSSCQ